ncbi:unnamed protein product [Phytomonas sp. EM1]|nr:unnamed protein product [Phytomonas sp. EM1]|eukprot:CCW60387.1 unnamed protein product [Phytomonas sp. isolate EM1]
MSPMPKNSEPYERIEGNDGSSTSASAHSSDSIETKHARVSTHATSIGHARGPDVFLQYRRSFLTSFFGSNEPERYLDGQQKVHPCKIFSKEVHKCLNGNGNNYFMCQSRVAALQKCMNEFKI